MGGQEHFYLEGQAALVFPQEGGDMVVHSSTQHPTEIQHKVAEALGLPMHAVRCEVRRMGGGFGGKESQGNALAVGCAVAARLTGRPCKMRYDRDDDMMITGKRHDFRISYDVGFDGEGVLTGVDFTQMTRCGWALDLSLPVADRAMLHADNAYLLPMHASRRTASKPTPKSATAYRGFGGPQGVLGIERVMDHIAAIWALIRSECAKRNYYATMSTKGPTASVWQHRKPPLRYAGQGFHPARDDRRSAETADYAPAALPVDEWNADNTVLKKGIGFRPSNSGFPLR